MSLLAIHDRLWITAIIYSIAMGCWAFFLAFQRRDLDSNFWGALVINEIIYIVQAVLGGYFLFQDSQPARWVHYLYVVVGVITIPAAFAFTKGRGTRREASVYGILLWFLAGIAVRVIMTVL